MTWTLGLCACRWSSQFAPAAPWSGATLIPVKQSRNLCSNTGCVLPLYWRRVQCQHWVQCQGPNPGLKIGFDSKIYVSHKRKPDHMFKWSSYKNCYINRTIWLNGIYRLFYQINKNPETHNNSHSKKTGPYVQMVKVHNYYEPQISNIIMIIKYPYISH